MTHARRHERPLLGYRLHLTARRFKGLVPLLRRRSFRWPYYFLLKWLFPRGMPLALSSGQIVRLHPRLLGIIKPETYEARLAQLFVTLASPGAMILDVGAHVGLHTLLFSHLVGINGRVVSVEPSPANAWLLHRHLAWNRCLNVEVIEAAIGNSEDTISFRFASDPTSGSAFENSLASEVEGEAAIVRMTTIDTICADRNPDLIKIDVEGAEFLALVGAREILARSSPILVVAIHPDEMRALRTTPAELIAYLGTYGYEGHDLDGRSATDPGLEEIIFRKVATTI